MRVSQGEVAPLAQFQAALANDAAFVAWVDMTTESVQEHWGCVVRSRGEPHWEQLPGSGPGGKWTKEDTDLPTQFQAALARPAQAAVDALAKRLHAQRLAPLSKHLTGVKRLLVAPVNRMAGIPIEVWTNQYTISYTPSATYLARFKDRNRPQSTGLLAVGDPVLLMDRFYRNLLGQRDGLAKPMGKAEALAEAKQWLRTLPRKEVLDKVGGLFKGVVRDVGEDLPPLLPERPDEPKDKNEPPFAHPRYCAAFILIGDPD